MMTGNKISNVLTVAAVAMAVLAGSAQAGEVAHYKLDGNVNDSSGNDYHGTATNVSWVVDATRGTVASFAGGNGLLNSSIDVSSSSYSVTESPNFQFAISMWLLPTARDDYFPEGATDVNIVMGASNGGVIELPGQGSWGGMSGGNPGGIGVNSGGGAGSAGKDGAINICDGSWHHFVIQWVDPDGTVAGNDGALAEIWIDGTAVTVSGAYNGNFPKSEPPLMNLGGPVIWSDGGSVYKYYKGLMSDVRFHDAQLTQSDVDDLLNPPGPTGTTIIIQ